MEKYIAIKNYEGYYEISNFGNVKSVERKSKNRNGKVILKEKILEPSINLQGYFNIGLRIKNRRKNFKIHRLVALHFISNPQNKKEVNHKDGNKANNNAYNLEWTTPKENTIHAHTSGLVKHRVGKSHHLSKAVLQFDLKGNLITEFENCNRAENFTPSMINRACNNLLKSGNVYKGFVWKFKTL